MPTSTKHTDDRAGIFADLHKTEQLAEILLHIADSCYWAGFFKGKDDDDGYDDECCLINQNIVVWLKQPHTTKETR